MVSNSPQTKQSACTSVISVNILQNRLSCWTPIKVVTEAKYLGVIFDRTLSYSSHVKYLKTNCLKALDILKVVGHTDWWADQKTLLCLYRALVRSKLDYGCIVYGAASNNILKKLDPIHHQGLRIALGAFRTSPVTKQKECL